MKSLISRLLTFGADAGLLLMPALDTVTATGTAIGAALLPTTIAPGDTFQIKNAKTDDNFLLNAWVDAQVAGMARIRSPKFHDNVDGIRFRTQIGVLKPNLPTGAAQRLYAQDVEIVEL